MSERPAPPSYKMEGFDSPAKLPPELLRPAVNGGTAATANSPLAEQPSLSIHSMVEERPKGDATATIVRAGTVLFRAITGQIAYHEGEAAKLRNVLRQFASATGAKAESVSGSDVSSVSNEDVEFLRDVLSRVGENK